MAIQSREKNFIKNTLILALGTFLPKATYFITLPIYTAFLTKTEYGNYDLIDIMCTLLLPIATLQIQSAAFRFLLDEKENESGKKTIITTLYSFVLPVCSIVLLIAFFLMNNLPIMLRVLIIWYYLADILQLVSRQVARGMGMNQRYSISSGINSFLNMVLVCIFLAILRTGLYGVLFSLSISATVSFVYLFFSMSLWRYIDFRSLNKQKLKEMLQYAWPMVPNNLSIWVMRVSDRLLISLFLGVEANAIYAVANKIPSILQLAQTTFSMAWSESASLTVNDSDADIYYSKMFHTIHRVLAGFTAILMACLPVLFWILIRGDYDEAYIHIPILIIAMFYSSVALFLGGLYMANKKTTSIGTTTVVAALVNFILNLLFIRQIGIYAATLSTAISYLVLMIYRMKNVQKFQKIRFNYKEIILTNAYLIIMACVCIKRSPFFYGINFIFGVVGCVGLNWKLLTDSWKIVRNKISIKRNKR